MGLRGPARAGPRKKNAGAKSDHFGEGLASHMMLPDDHKSGHLGRCPDMLASFVGRERLSFARRLAEFWRSQIWSSKMQIRLDRRILAEKLHGLLDRSFELGIMFGGVILG